MNGRVTDDTGSQAKSLGGGGTLSTAASVEALMVHDDGTTHALASADVQVDGS